MPRYRFTGLDVAGRPVSGERDAPDPDTLLAALSREVRQIQSVQVVPSAEPPQPAGASAARFRQGDDIAVSSHVAEIVAANLPLESGLAAIAAECPSRRMRGLLQGIAADLAAGSDLERALALRGAPAELRALVQAGARSGNTGQILEHYVVNVQDRSELRQTILRGLFYPLVLLAVFSALATFVLGWIVPQFAKVYEGFDLELPLLTAWLIAASEFFINHGATFIPGGIVAGLLLVGLGRLALGRANFRRLVRLIPVFGPLSRYVALARFSQFLSLLVENRVPLDEALPLAGEASGDPEIHEDCQRLVAGVKAGESLESSARGLGRFPASFVQALAWEKHAAGMPEVLQSLGDLYAGRARVVMALFVAFIPQILLVVIGGAASYLVIALFLPLIEFLNKLA